MQCGRRCSLCCYGLFDISFPDALIVAEGLSRLPAETRAAVRARAAETQPLIQCEAPELRAPYLLSEISEERIDRIVDRLRSPSCPFLGDQNECLIHEHRPLACRLEGAPMVDVQDGLFGDWFELTFTEGVPPEAIRDLERDYYQMQDDEENLTEALTQTLLDNKLNRAPVFIPSLVVEFESFWKRLLRKTDGSS